MEELVALLKEKKLTISSCESLTAGLFSAKIASISGASSVLRGGIVSYQNDVKERVAHVEADIIKNFGVISEECVRAMALHTNEIMKSDLCVSFSGNAGPCAMEGKPAGLVYCAIAFQGNTYVYKFQIQKERNALRNEVVDRMCVEVIRLLKGSEKGENNGY